MEINKLCKKLDNLPSNLKKGYIKDITNILDMMFEEYDIFYKDTNESVKKQIIINKFTSIFNENEKIQEVSVCKGFSQNGNKCFKRSQQNSNYCKVHTYLAFREKTVYSTLGNSNISDVNHQGNFTDDIDRRQGTIEQIRSNKNKIDILSLGKTFINNSFYYHDKRFIYDRDSLEKVGYIENENFILTDDPFILEIL